MNKALEEILSLKNMGGKFESLYQAIGRGDDCVALSLGQGEKVHVATHLDKKILYISADSVGAWNIVERCQDFVGDRVAMLPEKEDTLVYHKGFQRSSNTRRLRTLYDLAKGKLDVLVVSPTVLMQFLPSKKTLLSSILELKVGDTYNTYDLSEKLVQMGYIREEGFEERATFKLQGDLMWIFPTDSDLPIRISFFDDEIENIKTFNPDTMSPIDGLDKVLIFPDNDVLISQDSFDKALDSVRKQIDKIHNSKAVQRLNDILSEIELKYGNQSSQWLLPFIKDDMKDIFDYLSDEFVLVFDESSLIHEKMRLYTEETLSRVKTMSAEGECLPCHKNVIIGLESVIEKIQPYTKVALHSILSSVKFFSPKEIFKFNCHPIGNYSVNFSALVSDMDMFAKTKNMVVLCLGDKAKAQSMCESLYKEGVANHYSEDIEGFSEGINVTPLNISYSISYPQNRIVIVGKKDIVKGDYVTSSRKRSVFTIPKTGDYVVHEGHGIGRCIGVKREKTGSIDRDYVVLEYAGDAKLFVPIDQMDRLSRYSGSDIQPRLSQLGGRAFEKLKASVKASIKEMAINLLELYSERQKSKGHKYQEDNELQILFEHEFPYTETPDQLTAVKEIKADMEKGIVMDRLLCGDVGYGKTEVALRAVFKTIVENKQAAILAPTTILANQHYNTLIERMNEFDIKAELLTRFQNKEEIEKSLERLQSGQTLIAVGTHRILSKDVHFKDLGLLVLDEEQRFGVEDKEKLKVLKKNVNVLSLSATPIPRTLNMAMTGIRDISLLETPPSNRLPVQTYVLEMTDALMAEAIKKELARGGQVYVVSNRVTGIESIAEKIETLVPEASVIIGHGQMDSSQLERNINAFYSKQANVLVCTTIIENGLDVADANTLIVCDADRLGLSQLYQIRGRVGRRNRLAYAYFTVRAGKVLTVDATKRLNALLDYTDFGSGFKIAMRDMEIRGAGNILGREQHGHIQKVGYDLYCKMLKESVDELSGDYKPEIETEMAVNIDAYLDADYINSVDEKLKLYKHIAELANLEEKDKMLDSISKLYGEPPTAFVNLLEVSVMKNMAKSLLAKKVTINDKITEITFTSIDCCRNQSLMDNVEQFNKYCVFKFDERLPKLVFTLKYMSVEAKFSFMLNFLSKVCKF